jgi:hypothetical protein
MIFSNFLENKISPAKQHVVANVAVFLIRKIIENIHTKERYSNEI